VLKSGHVRAPAATRSAFAAVFCLLDQHRLARSAVRHVGETKQDGRAHRRRRAPGRFITLRARQRDEAHATKISVADLEAVRERAVAGRVTGVRAAALIATLIALVVGAAAAIEARRCAAAGVPRTAAGIAGPVALAIHLEPAPKIACECTPDGEMEGTSLVCVSGGALLHASAVMGRARAATKANMVFMGMSSWWALEQGECPRPRTRSRAFFPRIARRERVIATRDRLRATARRWRRGGPVRAATSPPRSFRGHFGGPLRARAH
jgi:hypothetical protein